MAAFALTSWDHSGLLRLQYRRVSVANISPLEQENSSTTSFFGKFLFEQEIHLDSIIVHVLRFFYIDFIISYAFVSER